MKKQEKNHPQRGEEMHNISQSDSAQQKTKINKSFASKKREKSRSYLQRKVNLKQQANQRKQCSYKYEENELTTYFENNWILRENLEKMKNLSKEYKGKIIEQRKDDNTDPSLTSEEEKKYIIMIKPEKKKQIKLLQTKLNNKINNLNRPISKIKKPGKYLGINFSNSDMIKFNGHYMKKEGYERIIKLCETMTANGSSKEKIAQVIKQERRKEERRLKKEFKQNSLASICTNNPSTFPQNGNECEASNVVACFRCNSLEHFARNCPINDRSDLVPDRVCYTCNEVGHMSRNCPATSASASTGSSTNNKKLCDECGSEEHLKRSCPKRQIFQQRSGNSSGFARSDQNTRWSGWNGLSCLDNNVKPKITIFDD